MPTSMTSTLPEVSDMPRLCEWEKTLRHPLTAWSDAELMAEIRRRSVMSPEEWEALNAGLVCPWRDHADVVL